MRLQLTGDIFANSGVTIDLTTSAFIPVPRDMFLPRSVSFLSNVNPLGRFVQTSLNNFADDTVISGSFTYERIGTAIFSGGWWRGQYTETVNSAQSYVTSVVAQFSFDPAINVYFPSATSVASLAGKRVGQLVSDNDTITSTQWADTLKTTDKAEIINSGSGDDIIQSRGGNDTINAGPGNDTISGGLGKDKMLGGTGDDRYFVDTKDDSVIEAAGSGFDTVFTTVSFTLRAGVEVEVLSVLDAATLTAINLVGNSSAQTIRGNNGANTITGLGGADKLFGLSGNDTLNGGAGNDVLTGGQGNDFFVFDNIWPRNVDTIVDFKNSAGNNDTIILENAVFSKLGSAGLLNSAYFKANATGMPTDANDYIVYNTTTGALFYDSNGSLPGSAVQFALIAGRPALTIADFLVV